MPWSEFDAADPELAAFGRERLHGRVAYLGTPRANGAPRVHPVTPVLGEGHLFLFMEPTSPKGKDLLRDSRFALHCAVGDNSGNSGEFLAWGNAVLIDDAAIRAKAAALSTYAPEARYILFELHPTRTQSTEYRDGGPVRREWNRGR